jgi:hypothetical protein
MERLYHRRHIGIGDMLAAVGEGGCRNHRR